MPSDLFSKIIDMPDSLSVSDLLESLSDRKLERMEAGVAEKIKKLGIELKMIQDARAKKQRSPVREEEPEAPAPRKKESNGHLVREAKGRFDGLPRAELLRHVRAMGQPVKPQEVTDYLGARGILRKVSAVRVGLIRLEKDGALVRYDDGRFAVPNGNGASPHAETPLLREQLGIEASESADSDE